MQYITLKGNVGTVPQLKTNANGKEYAAFTVFDNPPRRAGEERSKEKSPSCGVTVYAPKAREIAMELEKGQFVELHGEMRKTVGKDGTERCFMTPNFVRKLVRKDKKAEAAPAAAEA